MEDLKLQEEAARAECTQQQASSTQGAAQPMDLEEPSSRLQQSPLPSTFSSRPCIEQDLPTQQAQHQSTEEAMSGPPCKKQGLQGPGLPG